MKTWYPDQDNLDLAFALLALGVGYWSSQPEEALNCLKASSEICRHLLGERSTTGRLLAEAYLALFLAEQQNKEAKNHFQTAEKLFDLHKAKATTLGVKLQKLEKRCAATSFSIG